jgi:hypothetical protein
MMRCNAITANSRKFPAHATLKHKTIAKEKLAQGIIAWIQESGWMTENVADDWIKSVWF